MLLELPPDEVAYANGILTLAAVQVPQTFTVRSSVSYASAYSTCDYLLFASAPEPRPYEEAQSPFGKLVGQETICFQVPDFGSKPTYLLNG